MNLEPFSAILQQASGLTLRGAATASITNFIEDRMRTLGLAQPDEYQSRLEQDAEERQRLVEAAALPETWFNRDPAAFETLVKLVKDRLKKDPQPVRILCLPCSTGEEPYSIVAALTEAGITPGQFVLDAVDISKSALLSAQAGEYKAFSFRKCPEEFRTKYFAPLADDTWKLAAEWKGSVNFRQGNLLQLDTVAGSGPYDFVFNRNLLIYFARADQARALAHLRSLLKPDGVIFVAAGEGGIFLANGFRTLRIPHAFAFRLAPPRQEPKPKAPSPEATTQQSPLEPAADSQPPETSPDSPATGPTAAEPHAEKSQPPAAPAQETKAPKPEPRAPKPKPEKQAPKRAPKEPSAPRRAATPEDTVSLMEDIKDFADAGDFATAEGRLRGFLAGGSSDADAHYLMGLLQDVQGDAPKAMATYKRVIQLDSNHQEAMKQLAYLLELQGDKAESERLLGRAGRVQKGSQRRHPKGESGERS